MLRQPFAILSHIGNTRMPALRHVVPRSGARILLKLENENPTGSMKDRMALAMIEARPAPHCAGTYIMVIYTDDCLRPP